MRGASAPGLAGVARWSLHDAVVALAAHPAGYTFAAAAGRSVLLFDSKTLSLDRQQLAALGDVHTPSIADLFVAIIGAQSSEAYAQAQAQKHEQGVDR